MKLHPRNLWLLGAVLVCFFVELVTRPEEAPAIDRSPLFESLDPRRAAGLRVTGPKGSSEELVLARDPGDNEKSWILSSWFDFPAHGWVVEDALARLRGLTRSDLVSSDAGSAGLYGFDGNECSVTIQDAGGSPLATVDVAAEAEGRGSYIRPRGTHEIYRAPALAPLAPDPKRFVKADLFAFDPAEVKVIELELAASARKGAQARLERIDDGRWRKADGELLAPAKIDPLIAWASHLYLQEVVAAAPQAKHGLAEGGWARLRLELEDGECELTLGSLRAAEEGGLGERYATSANWSTPWVVTVSPLTAERLGQLAQALSP